jgi:mono/diheme cytochrome c family protein
MAMALLAAALGQHLLRAQAAASTRDGVYTDAQAARGEASYKKACASCHGATLAGSGAATPPLAGPDFSSKWDGQPLGDLFEQIQTTMPADKPGTLSRAGNAGILAYILKINRQPAGKSELPADAGALRQIKFDGAKR